MRLLTLILRCWQAVLVVEGTDQHVYDASLPLPWQWTYQALEMYLPRFILFAGGLDWSLPAVVSWDPPIGVLPLSFCLAAGVPSSFVVATTTFSPVSSFRPDSGDMLASDILHLPRSRAAGPQETRQYEMREWDPRFGRHSTRTCPPACSRSGSNVLQVHVFQRVHACIIHV